MKIAALILTAILFTSACSSQIENRNEVRTKEDAPILPGIYQFEKLLLKLGEKNIGVVTNHTGLINQTHLIDTLLSRRVNVARVFAPEHGFRGDVPDGEHIDNTKDPRTGLPISSLYGDNKKPSPNDLKGIEILLFDIQDVGARFYTYLSTLHYVMESAAENNILLIVLDRPNPNGFYIDGPILEEEFSSFVGLHPVPIVYGMTIGEYALMINGEAWLKNGVQCNLEVFECLNYNHSLKYQLPVKPSPNLPDMNSIYLYPSLCLFEGTKISVGRGTDYPFSVIGEPGNKIGNFSFKPKPVQGASSNPKHNGKTCHGYDLRNEIDTSEPVDSLQLHWIWRMYKETESQDDFFTSYFDRLAGNSSLRTAIKEGRSVEETKKSWQTDLENFKGIRDKYLLYP